VHEHLTELALEVPTELLATLLRGGQLPPELLAEASQGTTVRRFRVDIRQVSHG
jgi:hypothetical protein